MELWFRPRAGIQSLSLGHEPGYSSTNSVPSCSGTVARGPSGGTWSQCAIPQGVWRMVGVFLRDVLRWLASLFGSLAE